MADTITEKTPSRHIVTAINAIQKQIDKYESQREKLQKKIQEAQNEDKDIYSSIEGLQEQISKLKGE